MRMASGVLRGMRSRRAMFPTWKMRHGYNHYHYQTWNCRQGAVVRAVGGAAAASASSAPCLGVEDSGREVVMRRSAREQLAVMFRAAVRSVAEDNVRHSSAAGVSGRDGGSADVEEHAAAVASTVNVIPCERENARFGDYQCNDAMKVRVTDMHRALNMRDGHDSTMLTLVSYLVSDCDANVFATNGKIALPEVGRRNCDGEEKEEEEEEEGRSGLG